MTNLTTDYLVLLYNADLTALVADPIGPAPYEPKIAPGTTKRYPFFLNNTPGWRSISCKPRRNEAGAGVVVVNATVDLMAAVAIPEVRVAVLRAPEGVDAYIEMAGPLETAILDRDAERDGTDGLGMLSLQFTDDLGANAARTVYPNPAQSATGQTTTTKYVITAQNAETAARALLSANAGPAALAGRKYPEVDVPASTGAGTTVSASFTRAVQLNDALRYLLFIGGDLTMRTYQSSTVPPRVIFDVLPQRDLSAQVVFSWDLGNVQSLKYERGAPVATVALVGDATAGVNRVVRERTNAAAIAAGWRRREIFVDGRSAQNATELDQLGDKALEENAPVERLELVAIQTPTVQYPRDYRIGDLVGAEPIVGRFIKALVRGVDIDVTPDKGEKVSPLIGSDSGSDIDLKTAELVKLQRRLKQLEDAAGIN